MVFICPWNYQVKFCNIFIVSLKPKAYLSLFKKQLFFVIAYIFSFTFFSFSSFRISSNKTHFSLSRLSSLLLLHFTYAYLCFYFHPKIVSNRSVDHDPSEVPHMLFYIKTTLNHMERLKAGTNTAIII